jgi:hypothetical protein
VNIYFKEVAIIINNERMSKNGINFLELHSSFHQVHMALLIQKKKIKKKIIIQKKVIINFSLTTKKIIKRKRKIKCIII